MKKISIKMILDDAEMAALASMAKATKMGVNEYAVVCMKLGHAKVVDDFTKALEASKENADVGQGS
jgi:histidyl-tRNA synthetase